MARKSIFDTQFVQSAGLQESAAQAVKFFINNPTYLLSEKDLAYTYNLGLRLPSPINQIFGHLVASNKIQNLFAPIHVPKSIPVPEILTTSNDVTLDLAQILHRGVLDSLPGFSDKIVIDLSTWLRTNSSGTQHYTPTDINAIHALFVRGALVASYQDTNGWLNFDLNVFIVKTYALVISDIIASFYSLTLVEQNQIMAPLAMYMCQCLSGTKDDLAFPMLFNRCTFLGNQTRLNEFAKQMEHLSKDGLSITDVCQLIKEMGPGRLENFNAHILYRQISNLGPTATQSLIALEYPPYWVQNILLAISESKIGLVFRMKSNRLLDEAKRFAYSLNTSKAFLEILER